MIKEFCCLRLKVEGVTIDTFVISTCYMQLKTRIPLKKFSEGRFILLDIHG